MVKVDTYLLLKYFKCETSQAEEIQVAKWLADDPDGSHAAMYREARILFEGLTLYSDSVPAVNSVSRQAPKIVRILLSTAAAIAIVVISGLLGSRLARESYTNEYMTYSVPAGKTMQMTLADGTKVWMNGGSEIQVPVLFDTDSRNIKLNDGEIYLEVQKDSKRPFSVNTYVGSVNVLGTKFNVEADRQRQLFSTALLEGSVKVLTSGGECFYMEPSDVVCFENNVWSRKKMDNPYSETCWMDGLIDIANISFDRLMREFEKAFDVNVLILREELPELTITRGKIRISDGVESALDLLRLSAEFDYENDRSNNTIYIK